MLSTLTVQLAIDSSAERRTHPLAALALLAVALAPAPAFAQTAPPAVRLEYALGPGADRCDDEPALRRAVQLRLGRDPFAAEAPRTVAVRIALTGSTLTATVAWPQERARRRTIRSRAQRGCTELSRALALALAVAIDPLSLTRPPAPALPPPPPPEPAPPPPAPVVVAPLPPPPPPPLPPPAPAPPAPPPAPSLRVALVPALSVALGTAPGLADSPARPALGLGVRVARGPWGARFALRFEGPGQLTDAPHQASVLAFALAVSAGACWFPVAGRVRGELCALVAVTPVLASGSGYDRNALAATLALGLGVHAALEFSLARGLALGLWGELLGLPVRPALTVSGSGGGALWQAAPVGGALGLHLALSIR